MTLVVTDEHVLGLSPFREHGGAGLAARLAWSRPMLRPNGPHMIQTCRFFGGIYIYCTCMSCISCILFTNALVLQMHACSDNKHDSRPKQMQLGGNSRRMWFFARIWLMNGMECLVAEHNKSRCRKPQRRDAHALAVKQRHQNNTHIPCVYIYIHTIIHTHKPNTSCFFKLRSRLWCVFELAAFSKANSSGQIVLAPLFVETSVSGWYQRLVDMPSNLSPILILNGYRI